MRIAGVRSAVKGETDRLLTELAGQLQAEGLALAGIVRDAAHEAAYANGCDMHVRVLPAGPSIAITQDLGPGSDACRLNPAAISEAVARVEAGALGAADLFILNKFGPEEAAGRGFVPVIARALDLGLPVLVGVGLANVPAFDAFAGGLAETLPPEPDALRAWCLEGVAARV